jgi:hypothetical protein
MKKSIPLLLCIVLLSACGGEEKKKDVAQNNSNSGCGAPPVVTDATSGGCRIRLVSPKQCEEVDLTNGKDYEFAWTTDGTNCETPYLARVGGSPLNVETEENVNVWQMNAQVGRISRTGGVAKVTAADIENLTSTDGTFHWLITSYYGSHPASVAFKVKR